MHLKLKNAKRNRKLKVYGYKNYDGDSGIIIAKSYDTAMAVYNEIYDMEITEDHHKYTYGIYSLIELGEVKNNNLYVNAQR